MAETCLKGQKWHFQACQSVLTRRLHMLVRKCGCCCRRWTRYHKLIELFAISIHHADGVPHWTNRDSGHQTENPYQWPSTRVTLPERPTLTEKSGQSNNNKATYCYAPIATGAHAGRPGIGNSPSFGQCLLINVLREHVGWVLCTENLL